jgi:ADP-dependent NAD(P)H-hydrate dehydratase / NAD(P)H-hydrate epimerase
MPVPVISVEEMRAWEQATWDQGVSELEVIDQVGKAIADWISPNLKQDDRVLMLVGKGHNGDDGKAAARHLPNGVSIVIEIIDPAMALVQVEEALNLRPNLIVDCLFGIGLNRPLSQDWCELIEQINRSKLPIVSIDVPSGLNAQTGTLMGACIQADHTLTVGAPKAGMIANGADEVVGYIRTLSNVGLAAPPKDGELFFTEEKDFEQYPPRKRAQDHKGSLGHLAILAGSLGYHGAAVLAARAAMRAQTGLITLETMEACYLPVAAQLQQVMTRVWDPDWIGSSRTTGILIGPGLAAAHLPPQLTEQVGALWQQANCPIVVDASALDWIPKGETDSQSDRIITPHPGEAARLLDCTPKDIEKNRLQSLRKLSSTFGNCWVVLKGTHTLVGRAEGPVYANATGNPGLAHGGSGDVLAGLIGGLIAQPRCQKELGRSLRLAVWQHGKAADKLQTRGYNWTIEDLPDAISI